MGKSKVSHADERLMERFGISLTKEEYEELMVKFESYDPPPIFIEEDGRSFHLENIKGQEVVFLFDWKHRQIVTVYYKSWFKQEADGTWSKKSKKMAKFRRLRDRAREKYKNFQIS
jgi:hypothetical protein